MNNPELESQIIDVAAAWGESPYYDDAEQWTHLFWDADTPYRQMFNTLDLSLVVELACGHGRHSEQIAGRARRIVMVDIFEQHLEFCRRRLAHFNNIDYVIGNGKDFQPLANDCVSAIFCYDAMVHFSPDMVRSYVIDAARILKSGGMALFHHSNYSAAPGQHYSKNPHARNHMSTELFAGYIKEARLDLVDQQIVRWGLDAGIDAVSLLRKP